MLKSLVPEDLREGFTICMHGRPTIRDLIELLYFKSPELYRRVYNNGELMPDIVIFVRGVDSRLLRHLETELRDGDEIVLLAYIHGG